MKPKPRTALRDLMASFERWRQMKDRMPHTELAEIVLDESGYTEMWQKDRSADAAGRLENLKELVRSMEEFENLQGFLEHISLVMDRESGEGEQAVNIMTLHSAKGLEFDTVFLPGWEEGLFPHQRSLDESGKCRPGGGAPPRPCRPHARAQTRQDLFRHQPAHPRHVDLDSAVALSRRAAGRACRGDGGGGRRRRLRHVGLRPFTLRRDGLVRLQLHHARLAARAGAQGARGIFSENGQPRYVPDGVFDEVEKDEGGEDHPSPSGGRWGRVHARRKNAKRPSSSKAN